MSETVVETLKQTFAAADKLTANDLGQIYAPEIVFVDPLGRVEGLGKLVEYFAGVYKNVESCRFHYLDECRLANKTTIKWDMYFKHPKIGGGEEIKVRGISCLEFGNKITFHEDIYDVGSLMYEHIPLLGAPVRFLKRRAHSAAFKK